MEMMTVDAITKQFILPAAPQRAVADAAGGELRVLHVVRAQVHTYPAGHHRHRLLGGTADGALC